MEKIILKQVGWYHNEISIPTVGWNKPIYMVWEGALRAVKFEKIELGIRNKDDWKTYDPDPVYHLNIAGVGSVQVNGRQSCLCKDYWLSPADYPSHDKICEAQRMKCTYTFTERLASCFGVPEHKLAHSYRDSIYQATVLKIERYRWDGTKPVIAHIEVPTVMYYTEERGWYFEEPCELPPHTYPTRNECKDANEVYVVEFEDDEKADAEEQLRRDIREEVMRSFNYLFGVSDIETLYASIVDAITEDVKECSDYPHYNGSDIRLAIQRAVMHDMAGIND